MGRRLVIIGDVPSPDVTSLLIEGRSLHRLATMMGLDHCAEVHRRYDARNIVPARDPSGFTGKRSRQQAASEMLPSLIGTPVVLLGNEVATAFGVLPRPHCEWRSVSASVGRRQPVRLMFATVPHPSTSNRNYNDRAVMGVVTKFLREVRDQAADGSLYARAEEGAAEYERALRRGEVADLLCVQDVATHLGCTTQRVEMLIRDRRIGYLRTAGGPRFRWEHIAAYEAMYEVPPAEVVTKAAGGWSPWQAVRIPPDVGPPAAMPWQARRKVG